MFAQTQAAPLTAPIHTLYSQIQNQQTIMEALQTRPQAVESHVSTL